MENYIQAADHELWMIIQNNPLIPKRAIKNGSLVPKKLKEFNSEDFKMIEKNAKAKRLLYFGLILMSILAFLSSSQPKR